MALDKLELTENPGFEQAMRGNQKQILQFFTTAFAAKKVGEKLSKAEYKGLQKFLELGENSRNDPAKQSELSRRIAVQLNDRAQHTINLYLRGDAGELAKRYYETQVQIYARNPLYLKAAMHLIEPSHNARFVTVMNLFMPKWQHYRDELNNLPVRHEDWDY